MTDQFASLSPTALKEIIAHLDDSIVLFDKLKGRMTASEIQAKSMLAAVRRQLMEQLSENQND